MTTPADYAGIQLWLPSAYTQYHWDGTVGGSNHPTADGDPVRNIESQVSSRVFTVGSDARRPFWKTDATRYGSLHLTTSTAVRYMTIASSTATFNYYHTTGVGTIFLHIKFESGSASANQFILDSCESGTANKGIVLLRNTSEQIQFQIMKGSAGTPVVSITTTDTITDTNWHTIKVRCATGTNNTSVTIDGGTPKTGTQVAAGTGNTTNNLCFGQRSNLSDSNSAFAQISDLIMLNQAIDSGDETHWDSWNPPVGGPIATRKKVYIW